MHNLDITDTRAKLLTYAEASLLTLSTGSEMPLLPAARQGLVMLFSGFNPIFLAFGLLASASLGSVVALLAARSKITLHITISAAIASDVAVIALAFIISKLAWCSEYVNDICVDQQISPFQRQVADHATFIIYGTVVPVSAITAILLARRKNMSQSNGDSSIV